MATDDQTVSAAPADELADEELTGEALVRWWRVPLSLRIVAYAFILVGVLSIEEMLLDWLVFSRWRIDFLFVGIFIGRGLLRWRESSRGWAVFFTWIGLIFLSVWFPLAVDYLLFGLIPGRVGGASPGGLVIGAGALGYFVWQLRVLRRPDIMRRFQAPRLERLLAFGGEDPAAPHGRWQFSLGSLLLMMAIVAFGLARLTEADVLYVPHYQLRSKCGASRTHRVNYSYRTPRLWDGPAQLQYAVLYGGNAPASTWYTPDPSHPRLIAPNYRELPLPTGAQLYEIVDREIHSCDERVTVEELENYISSDPADWSIDALIKYAERMRQQQAAAKNTGSQP